MRFLFALHGLVLSVCVQTAENGVVRADAPNTLPNKAYPILDVPNDPESEDDGEWERRIKARVHERQLLDAVFSGSGEAAEIVHLLDTMLVDSNCMGYGSQTFMQASFKPPLHMAVLVGNLVAVQLLLERNASQSASAHGLFFPAIFYIVGETPAAFSPEWDDGGDSDMGAGGTSGTAASILQLLINNCIERSAGCSLNHQERTELRSATPLIAAIRNRHFEAALLLVASGHGAVDLDLADKDGYTPLMHAAQLGHRVLCSALLKSGADWSATDFRLGRNALHIAVVSRSSAVAALLLNAGAGASDVLDLNGMTPFDIAKQQVPAEVSVLQQFEADAQRIEESAEGGNARGTGLNNGCMLPHVPISAPNAPEMVKRHMSLGQAFILKTQELSEPEGSQGDGLDEFGAFVSRFGNLELKIGDGPYAEKHGKESKTSTIADFANSAEARDEQWIGFDNQFFRNPSNAGLRAAMATHFEKWKIGASCGSKIGGPDGLGGSQLSFGLKGSGAHLHMHNTAFNYLFFGEKKWTFNLG